MKTKATVKERLEELNARIAQAAQKSGRTAQDVQLVAVTKGLEPARIQEAIEAGVVHLGENRIQEAETKIPFFAGNPLQWHMIGHLQSNKIAKALDLFQMVQSVDSVRLARELNRDAAAAAKMVDVLLEVNISGEQKKFGFSTDDIYTAVQEIQGLPKLRVRGLMGLGPFPATDEEKRAAFKKLKGIYTVCRGLKGGNLQMQYLSMGMSDDFEIAIEEGSNMIRIGRALFQ